MQQEVLACLGIGGLSRGAVSGAVIREEGAAAAGFAPLVIFQNVHSDERMVLPLPWTCGIRVLGHARIKQYPCMHDLTSLYIDLGFLCYPQERDSSGISETGQTHP